MDRFLTLLVSLVCLTQFNIAHSTALGIAKESAMDILSSRQHNNTLVFAHVVSKSSLCDYECVSLCDTV